MSGNPQYLRWIESVKGRYRQSQIYSFYAGQKEIVAQLVRQIAQLPTTADDSDPVMPFPAFLGMIPWGHHIDIFEGCKDAKEVFRYCRAIVALMERPSGGGRR